MNTTLTCMDIEHPFTYISNGIFFGLLGFFGTCITYYGNKIIKPTLYMGGTLISTMSSYKLLNITMNYTHYHDCMALYTISFLCGLVGGFNLLKWYYLINFMLGFSGGASIGYLLYVSFLQCKLNLGKIWIFDNLALLCIICPGFISGIYSLKKDQETMMLVTAIIGPFLVIYSGNILLFHNENVTEIINSPIHFCVYILMMISGLYLQRKRYLTKQETLTYK